MSLNGGGRGVELNQTVLPSSGSTSAPKLAASASTRNTPRPCSFVGLGVRAMAAVGFRL